MEPNNLLDQLSDHLKHAVARAISFATRHGHAAVMPVHLLYALSEEKGAIAAELLKKVGIGNEYLATFVSALPATHAPEAGAAATATIPGLNPPAKQALERAMLVAYETESAHVGTEHLLYGILHTDDEHIAYILKKFNLNRDDLVDQLLSLIEHTNNFPEIDDVDDMLGDIEEMIGHSHAHDHPPVNGKKKNSGAKTKRNKTTDLFTTDLTSKESLARIDPVIGRDAEMDRLIHILSRRNKNNPLLLGEPGVGKTAIVEGLAKRIGEGVVPPVLRNKKILSLDMALLIAGTMYRGEFESRLTQIIDEVSEDPDTILFIDELHNIIGAGSNQGTMDAANILKPALARGQLRCIGATTIDEFDRHIKNDPALERRFQPIYVEEPSVEETIAILSGVKQYYEAFHGVLVDPSAVTAAATLSATYVHDNHLPDKAIDLLDEAAAAVKTNIPPTAEDKRRFALEAELEQCRKNKEAAISAEQFEQAMAIKKREQELEAALASKEKRPNRKRLPRVSDQDIARVLGRKLATDPNILLQTVWEKLETLPNTLAGQIVGQQHVIDRVAVALKKAHLGVRAPERPLASLLFTGPSGVGKTALAQALAKHLYHDASALIRLDMSEFAEQHGISKLLGSPAGYVGYKERNRFLDAIRKRPYAVVLFDEVDKAHPDVIKLLLQILDEGYFTDSIGKKIHLRHAINILTTNIGAERYRSHGIGFEKNASLGEAQEQAITNDLKETLGNALLGRIDDVCIFRPLSETDLTTIAARRMQTVNDALKKNNLSITADSDALLAMVRKAKDTDTGVRAIEHTVEHIVASLAANELKKKRRKKQYALKQKEHNFVLV